MQRHVADQLLAWKNESRRKPFMLRGARQVGKTWSVLDFGRREFPGSVHLVDLEKHPDWHGVFEENLSAARILSALEVLLNRRIVPGRDLLFLDEIQACPRAIMALRYLYEECPDLHVVAAGSLLEFAMRDVSFPVGREQFLTLFPMSFAEFLLATGKDLAAEVVLSTPRRESDAVHAMLLEELRQYLFVGGMPECVRAYAASASVQDAFGVQAELVNAYREDFAKYGPRVDKRCLDTVFAGVARSAGQQVKYSRLAEGYPTAVTHRAFDLLCLAQVVRRVSATSPAGLPLGASVSARRFKALMVDVGLMQSLCGLSATPGRFRGDLLALHEGAMAEQFVGQELLAAGQNQLYYWARDARNSNAEVDYLITREGLVFPVEVKSGSAGRLRSMHMLLSDYPGCPRGYVFSCAPYSELPDQRLVFLPLYYAFNTGRIAVGG